MNGTQDVIVLGAGPAGMAAAARLRSLDVPVTLVDEQPAPGGQIWRNVEANQDTAVGHALGSDYAAGAGAATALRASGCALRFGTQVWQLEEHQPDVNWQVFRKTSAGLQVLPASVVLLAGGAQERPNPFPGWTLPGVVSIGDRLERFHTSLFEPAARAGRKDRPAQGPRLAVGAAARRRALR